MAAVDVHYNPMDSFYLEEATQRIQFYPPPYYGMYFTPWLWFDGNQHGTSDFTLWDSIITDRMNKPAPVTATIWGDYTPGDGSGTVYAQFRNDSSAAIEGIVVLVVTEDSIHYQTPNGVEWQNSVPRDYLPDHNGTFVSIAPGDSVTVSQPFTIAADWNDSQCSILAWIQDTVMQPDTVFEIYQGAMAKVAELAVVEQDEQLIINPQVYVRPNPASGAVMFLINSAITGSFTIKLYDILGREIRTLNGDGDNTVRTVVWDGRDSDHKQVSAGIYLYRFNNALLKTTGKIILR